MSNSNYFEINNYDSSASKSTTNLATGSIEDLKNMNATLIGKYNLLENNIEKSLLKNKGYIYIDTKNNWKQLEEGNIYFNVLDKNGNNILNTLNQLIAENIYQTNYIIIKIENKYKTNCVFFYLNTPLNVMDGKNSVIEFLVVKPDFIDYDGSPNINDEYTISYILKDPSNQKNLKELPLIAESTKTAPVNAQIFKPSKHVYKENKVKKSKGKYKFSDFYKKENILIICFTVIICIMLFNHFYKKI